MASVFGNVFRLSGGASVWANVFVLEQPTAITRIGTLFGATKRRGTLIGASKQRGELSGATKKIGTLLGTDPQ